MTGIVKLEGTEIEVDVLVVGAGPTGLGAAFRLNELSTCSWVLMDSESKAGGLASTITTREGFLFDMGGHVIFSHYSYFDKLLNRAVGIGDDYWNTLDRESFVWIRDGFVPYPFQNNLHALPISDQIICVDGLIDAHFQVIAAHSDILTFDDWIMRNMGAGIAELFMRPYNYKVWAYPTSQMCSKWLGERVASVDLKGVIRSIIVGGIREETQWGPNSKFKFPKVGGTGSIWTKVAAMLPIEKVIYDSSMVGLELDLHLAVFSNGIRVKYKKLISTAPLDVTLAMVGRQDLGERLKYSSTHVIGIGVRGVCPHKLKCWMYYPESNCPFYRCTVFSNYAAANCPEEHISLPTLRCADMGQSRIRSTDTGPYWSLMFEVSESADYKLVNVNSIVEETIQGAICTNLLLKEDEIVSIFHKRLERGYPTPHITRDSVLDPALDFLKKADVWSRGRFGSWKYEVGNQDHSVMLGVEAVDNILLGVNETTL